MSAYRPPRSSLAQVRKSEIMTPDRSFAPEVMAINLVPYMRSLQKLDVTFTVTFRLDAVEKYGNQLIALVGSDYGGVAKQRTVDQVVINHGTIPLDDLYFELKPASINLGEVSHNRLSPVNLKPSSAIPKVSSSSSASATPSLRAIRMRRSTTPFNSLKISSPIDDPFFSAEARNEASKRSSSIVRRRGRSGVR